MTLTKIVETEHDNHRSIDLEVHEIFLNDRFYHIPTWYSPEEFEEQLHNSGSPLEYLVGCDFAYWNEDDFTGKRSGVFDFQFAVPETETFALVNAEPLSEEFDALGALRERKIRGGTVYEVRAWEPTTS